MIESICGSMGQLYSKADYISSIDRYIYPMMAMTERSFVHVQPLIRPTVTGGFGLPLIYYPHEDIEVFQKYKWTPDMCIVGGGLDMCVACIFMPEECTNQEKQVLSDRIAFIRKTNTNVGNKLYGLFITLPKYTGSGISSVSCTWIDPPVENTSPVT